MPENTGYSWAIVLQALDQLLQQLDAGSAGDLPATLGSVRPLAERLLAGVEPREALLNLRKLAAVADADQAWPAAGPGLDALATVLSAGPELARLLCQDPDRVALLLDPGLGRAWTREELSAGLQRRTGAASTAPELTRALTAFRNDQYVRLAACEFGQTPLEVVGQQLSALADLCLERALAFALEHQASRTGPALGPDGAALTLAVIAMGKYGAQELNFCSDIDLIYLYSSDEGSAAELSPHEHFSRVCRLVTRLVSEPNAEGFSFRVDLRLRPEGNQGPVCNSLSGAERYYETWGGPWDRLAWLKGRPAAGDLDLGQQMVQILRPFVFPRSIRPEIVEQLQQLNTRIQGQRPGQGNDWNVKLHAGGIREVEFFVQALQLLHAGKQAALQAPSTLAALDKLLFAGLISEQEHRGLGQAYELWRRLEHRLQLYAGRQTHLLPGAGPRRAWIAAHLGLAADLFEQLVARHRQQVSAVFATLGGDASEPQADGSSLAPLLDQGARLAEDEALPLLAEAGFAQPRRALEQLALLQDKPWGPLGRSPSPGLARLALPLLTEISRSPDPDAALHHLVELSLRFGPYSGMWGMLSDNPKTLRLLVNLFGSSDYLARLFCDNPQLLDQLLSAGHVQPRLDRAQLDQALQQRLSAVDPDDLEARLTLVGRFRNEEVLRIGLHDIASGLDQDQVWEQLTDLADCVLAAVYPLLLAQLCQRHGRLEPAAPGQDPAAMVVLGLGKLGSRELTYASDLDLIFVFRGNGTTSGPRPVSHAEFFTRLAQRLIHTLGTDMGQGRLYEVDTRLRPSGNQGTLICSLESFEAYHQRQTQIWERQALIKARAVAGDPGLGQQLERWIVDHVYGEPLQPQQLRRQIHRHRQRMEHELAREQQGFHDLKLGRGGMLDIDFVVQYLQLRHGQDPALRVRSTPQALGALAASGHLTAELARDLEQSYRFLRRLESRLRMVRDRPAARLPGTAQGLEVMARRLGYRRQPDSSPGAQLLQEYQRQTDFIRSSYRQFFD